MPDTSTGGGSKLQSFRTVLECLIVGALMWTGSSLVQLKTQGAVIQSQLAAVQVTIADVPALRIEQVKSRAELDQLRVEMNQKDAAITELRKLRGLR